MLTIDGESLTYGNVPAAKRNEPIRRYGSYLWQTQPTAVTQLNYASQLTPSLQLCTRYGLMQADAAAA